MINATRRLALSQLMLATAAGAAAAELPTAPLGIEPHLAWGAEWRPLLAYCNGPELGRVELDGVPEWERLLHLEWQILTTPAATLAGVNEQLAVMLQYAPPVLSARDKDAIALRNVHRTVFTLIERRAVA